MKLLFVGDVVGSAGRRLIRRRLRVLRERHGADLVVVNAENAAGGAGLTMEIAQEMFRAGADVLTSGNHIWDKQEGAQVLDQFPAVLRPQNYPDPAPGSGVFATQARDGTPVCVVNLMGRVFLPDLADPFRTADRILQEHHLPREAIIVDFHAEATSEKMAMGWYLDGRVSAVVGTHTHVPTADARILPGGTAYLTDAGMTGCYDSVIGVERDRVLQRFLSQRPVRFRPSSINPYLAGAVITVSPVDGRAESIETILENDTGAGLPVRRPPEDDAAPA